MAHVSILGKVVLRRSNSAAPAPCQLLWPFTAEVLVDDSMVMFVRENLRTVDIVRTMGKDLEALNGRQRACSERVMELYRQQLRLSEGLAQECGENEHHVTDFGDIVGAGGDTSSISEHDVLQSLLLATRVLQ